MVNVSEKTLQMWMNRYEPSKQLLDSIDIGFWTSFMYMLNFMVSCIVIAGLLYVGIKYILKFKGIEDSITLPVKLYLAGLVVVISYACAYVGDEINLDRNIAVAVTNCSQVHEDISATKFNSGKFEGAPSKLTNFVKDLRADYKSKCAAIGIVGE